MPACVVSEIKPPRRDFKPSCSKAGFCHGEEREDRQARNDDHDFPQAPEPRSHLRGSCALTAPPQAAGRRGPHRNQDENPAHRTEVDHRPGRRRRTSGRAHLRCLHGQGRRSHFLDPDRKPHPLDDLRHRPLAEAQCRRLCRDARQSGSVRDRGPRRKPCFRHRRADDRLRLKTAGSAEAVAAEVEGGAEAIIAAGGRAPRLVPRRDGQNTRPAPSPKSSRSATASRGIRSMATAAPFWAPQAWPGNITAPKDGDVIISHINQPTHEAGEGVVKGILDLKARGFHFVRLNDRTERSPARVSEPSISHPCLAGSRPIHVEIECLARHRPLLELRIVEPRHRHHLGIIPVWKISSAFMKSSTDSVARLAHVETAWRSRSDDPGPRDAGKEGAVGRWRIDDAVFTITRWRMRFRPHCHSCRAPARYRSRVTGHR